MLRSWIRKIHRFLKDDSGPTAVEYAVMLMGIILAVITTVQVIGGIATSSLQDSQQKIENAKSGS